jgi:hypothetical protein
VQFLVDGTSVLTVDAASAEYWVYKGFVNGVSLSPGDHTVFARATYTTNPGPAAQIDSRAVTISVQAAPAYGQIIDMTGDLTLTEAASWTGTSASRIRVNRNCHRIYTSGL